MRRFFHFALAVSAIGSASAHWKYGQQLDAEEWIGQCTIGKQQSPIEIFQNDTIPISMPPFIFEFYANPPKAESLTNNGHSITFTLKAQREITYPKVVGGGLPGVYQFEQFHFHWGKNDTRGSEHNINGATHPMELHLVHFNSLYGSNLAEAMNNSKSYDTIAVLAVLFEIQEEDNPDMKPITDALKFIEYQNDIVNNVTLFPLEHLLPKDRTHFFRYNGSLTTPPCSEIVIWSIFEVPIFISENQMNEFRKISDLPESESGIDFESESDNFRQHQALNDRKVYLADTNAQFDGTLTIIGKNGSNESVDANKYDSNNTNVDADGKSQISESEKAEAEPAKETKEEPAHPEPVPEPDKDEPEAEPEKNKEEGEDDEDEVDLEDDVEEKAEAEPEKPDKSHNPAGIAKISGTLLPVVAFLWSVL